MRITLLHLSSAILVSAACVAAAGQVSSPAFIDSDRNPIAPPAYTYPAATALTGNAVTPAVELLRQFRESDVKFDLATLMDILRDRRHEGWVLAAYPDPKTGQPLIGAGVSLDLPARVHLQRDPLNPHPFLEPSSAELWLAAGLDPAKLQSILGQFQDRLSTWEKRRFRNRIGLLEPQITHEEATLLLRIAVVQAIYNAKAYCRNFDRLTPSQQMALSQLVYQMGVNLEEFSQFLRLINTDSGALAADARPQLVDTFASDNERWRAAQQSLMQSQWARLYRTRAVAVIAMLDPEYSDSPASAERRISASLAPAVIRRHRGRAMATRELASVHGRGRAATRKAVHARKRKA